MNIPSTAQYKRISSKKSNGFNFCCRCATCDLLQDFAMEYYRNAVILMDNDSLVHIPKVSE